MIPRRWAHTLENEQRLLDSAVPGEVASLQEMVAPWEAAIATYVGVPQAAAVSSGRRGMALIFEHLAVRAGDEIIVPAYTLKDLIPLIQGLGAKAVPADIDPETFSMRSETLRKCITPRTKAILALHPFGAPCAIDTLLDTANRHGLPVIEDCAHSLGARFQGRQTGSFGYAGFFSFEPTKPVNTYGGGMVVSKDCLLIERVRQHNASGTADTAVFRKKARTVQMEQRLFRMHLAFPFLFMAATPRLRSLLERGYRGAQQVPAGQAQYLPVQAALGLRKLETLDARIEKRNQNAALLTSLLKSTAQPQRLLASTQSTYYFFIVKLPVPAAAIRRKLLFRGVDAAIESEIADDCAALLNNADCPVTRELAPRLMALPMFDGISEAQLRRTAAALNAIL